MIDSSMINKIVSFQVYPQFLLGVDFNRCKVLGILDVESARSITDVASLAYQAYPTLPEGSPQDYREYLYVKVQLSNGQPTCVAMPWIKQETLVVHEDVTATLTISRINADDIDKIVRILKAHNYNHVSVG